uniref:C2 domain-containing protein n=1 Tax=Odontella aurita TaxID=265563 RepID=A0A7S4I1A8_9STRA|mmetsp:Transcript_18507/g.53369  ORF Transcript_18507/g.53369 Transcript_18507/m.53369 type:complete len:878 (+) Transcript_18507:251-2884(+)
MSPNNLVSLNVTVRVIQGRNLVAMDRSLVTRKMTSSDPYVRVLFGGETRGKTPVVKKTLNPRWDAAFSMTFDSGEADRIARAEADDRSQTIELRIIDEDAVLRDDPMGTVFIPLTPSDASATQWYSVERGRYGTKHYCKRACGELEVEVTTERIIGAQSDSMAVQKCLEEIRLKANMDPVLAAAEREAHSGASTNSAECRNSNKIVAFMRKALRKKNLSDRPPEGAIVRNQLAAGQTSSFRRVSEAAKLYGTVTDRYLAALADEEEDVGMVLGQVYDEIEARQLTKFCRYYAEDPPTNEPDKKSSTEMTKVLNAATKILTETIFFWEGDHDKSIGKLMLGPDFESNVAVDCVWVAAAVSICACQIADHAGGKEGCELPNLTVDELLDIIAWIHYFRGVMAKVDEEVCSSKLKLLERTFASVDFKDASSQPALFTSHERVTESEALERIAFACRALACIHACTRDELLVRTKATTLEWASRAYKAVQAVRRMEKDQHNSDGQQTLSTGLSFYTLHSLHETADGHLFTSFAEDIFTPMSIQLRTISNRLPMSSNVLPPLFAVVLSTVRSVQLQVGNNRLTTFERRCAAANDFERMGEAWERAISDILPELNKFEPMREQGANNEEKKEAQEHDALQGIISELVHTFASDAVRAAQSVVVSVFNPIRLNLEPDLFGQEWEDNHTNNELVKILTATIEDFLHDLDTYLGAYLLEKATESMISASIVFYIECLLKKAGGHGGKELSSFGNNSRALVRMKGDISIMRSYFEEIAQFTPSLNRTIDNEFKILDIVYEILSIAAGQSASEPSDFILLLHSHIKDARLTRKVVKDLWTLIAPEDKKQVKYFLAQMEPHMIPSSPIAPPERIPGFCLEGMATRIYSA